MFRKLDAESGMSTFRSVAKSSVEARLSTGPLTSTNFCTFEVTSSILSALSLFLPDISHIIHVMQFDFKMVT